MTFALICRCAYLPLSLSLSHSLSISILQSCCPLVFINCRTSLRALGGGGAGGNGRGGGGAAGGGNRRDNGARAGSADPAYMNSTASSEIHMNVMRARQYSAVTPTTMTAQEQQQLHPLYTN